RIRRTLRPRLSKWLEHLPIDCVSWPKWTWRWRPDCTAVPTTQAPRRGKTKHHGCRHPHDEDDGTRGGVSGLSEGQLTATFSFSPSSRAAGADDSAGAPCASGSSESSSNGLSPDRVARAT